MDDLNDLASAASEAKKPRTSRGPRHAPKSSSAHVIIGGIITVVAIAVVTFYALSDKPGVVYQSAAKVVSGGKPNFSVHQAADTSDIPVFVGWIITNEDTSPLEVHSVTYNGEFQAPLGVLKPGGVVTRGTPQSEPVKITIGESAAWWQSTFRKEGSYAKQVVFIDIKTSRGTFRYRPGKGFE